MKVLRGYQREAVDALNAFWDSGRSGLIVAPTGSGKSLIIAEILRQNCEKRILILTHVKELIQQNHDEFFSLCPDIRAGIFSAGLKRKDFHDKIIFAGIQSISKHIHKLYPAPDIVVIDEAHLIPSSDQTRYAECLKTLCSMNPKIKVLGLTATPYRLDSGYLHDKENSLFEKVVFDIKIQRLINEGFLCNLVLRGGSVCIDTSGVHHLGKEFVAGELEKAAMSGDITEKAVSDMVTRASDRKKWLVFACGVAHARQIFECLEAHGIRSSIVTGETPSHERERIIEVFKTDCEFDTLRCIVNVNVLTTGFNAPCIDMIAMLRPTESASLYVQSVGRGMRIFKNKKDCLVLDYAGNAKKHGPIDDIKPKDPSSGDGIAPAKECPECWFIMPAGLSVCPDCGYVFPVAEIKIHKTPVDAPILKIQKEEPKCFIIDKTFYSVHVKKGTDKQSIKCRYTWGIADEICEWVSADSSNPWAANQYANFCKRIGMEYPYPRNARTFCERVHNTRSQVDRLWAEKDGKFWRVLRKTYKEDYTRVEYNDEIPF